jgi:hypothetical protein
VCSSDLGRFYAGQKLNAMNRKDFFKRLGIGLCVAVVTPNVFSSNVTSINSNKICHRVKWSRDRQEKRGFRIGDTVLDLHKDSYNYYANNSPRNTDDIYQITSISRYYRLTPLTGKGEERLVNLTCLEYNYLNVIMLDD